MEAWLFQHESEIRDTAFYGVLILIALWEVGFPRRELAYSIVRRWLNNIALTVCNMILVRWFSPVAGIAMAAMAAEDGWGLLNQVELSAGLHVLSGLLLMDLLAYFTHRLSHGIPLLWRLHAVHHADPDFDFTTAHRHHPLETLVHLGFKLGGVVLLGPAAASVLIYELLRGGLDLFNHGNVTLPAGLDRLMRVVLVTPDYHRVHHSTQREETDSNYCSLLPWWDHLFGTYRATPRGGHVGMTVGLEVFREPEELYLHRLLTQPFRTAAASMGEPGPAGAGSSPATRES